MLLEASASNYRRISNGEIIKGPKRGVSAMCALM